MSELQIRDENNAPVSGGRLREWKHYYVRCAGADSLLVGGSMVAPLPGNELFHIRFENQLGYTTILPYHDGRPIPDYSTYRLLIVTDKFGTSDREYDTAVEAMLNDLYEAAATLAFNISTLTNYGVTESPQPPSPLFTLYFMLQYREKLAQALEIIQSSPHRKLRDYPDFVPLHEASEIDADVLITALRNPQFLVSAPDHPLARNFGGYVPSRIWQRRSEETYDTPENRFALYIIREMLTAAERLATEEWWGKLDRIREEGQSRELEQFRKEEIQRVTGILRQAADYPIFAEVGQLQHLPIGSQVMRRRAGYRELYELWQSFRCTSAPFVTELERAIDLRDAAKMYEYWVYFELVRKMVVALGQDVIPNTKISLSPLDGLGGSTSTTFYLNDKQIAIMIYNREKFLAYYIYGPLLADKKEYHIGLRPDYTLILQDGRHIGFDAKFRISQEQKSGQYRPEQDDMVKMLSYLGGLGLQAAIVCYPGDNICFDANCTSYDYKTDLLAAAVSGNYQGIAAIPMKPTTRTN